MGARRRRFFRKRELRLTVNVGGQTTPTTLVWGSNSADVGTKIVGPLMLNDATAGNVR